MGVLLGRLAAARSVQWRESAAGDDGGTAPEETGTGRPMGVARTRELEEFKAELSAKREARRKLIAEKSDEMRKLRQGLAAALAENKRLLAVMADNNLVPPADETDGGSENSLFADLEARISAAADQNRQLRCEIAECHAANNVATTEVSLLGRENTELKKHIRSLKEINKVSKEMIGMREAQLQQLKGKLTEIETSLADRELRTLSSDLRSEYERQLENIRNLRGLYEERARVAEVTRQNLLRDLEQQKSLTEFQTSKCVDLEARVAELEKELSDKNDILGNKESQLGVSKAEARDLQAEMTVINQLFSQMLLGYNNTQDLDKLVLKLEENHDLLTDMVVREDCSEVSSALPKLILDLISQVDASESKDVPLDESSNDSAPAEESTSSAKTLTPAEEIVCNLPKVWRVLMELLSHQAGPQTVLTDITDKTANSCYKSVDTPSGPRLVPSVSKTYIRLKDLILEKKALQKEMNRLKQLNGHLESRLQDQERRLGLVSSELNKTWHVVGRMQRQHQQLHTHEQILRFELQQKRILLSELKEELEFCKEKWDRAKQKNSESQEEWNKLRLEFASRKVQSSDSVNNSAESGYSDERPSDDDSDDSTVEKIAERKRVKKRNKSIESVKLNQQDDPAEGEKSGEDLSKKSDDESNDSQNCEAVEGEAGPSMVDDEIPDSQNESSKTNYEDALAKRSARLKKLEEQCYVLVHKVTKNNNKGIQLCNRLEKLHNQYGGSEDGQGPSTSNDGASESSFVESKVETNLVNTSDTDKTVILGEAEEDKVSIECASNDDQQSPGEKSDENSLSEDTGPSTSSSVKFDYEAKFAARDERLRRMESQAKNLVNRVSNTNVRGEQISNKLTELHNSYGREESTSQSSCTLDTTGEDKTCDGIKVDENNVSEQSVNGEVESLSEAHVLLVGGLVVVENNKSENASSSECGPSSSATATSFDYEAHFAARDERLKRMEDQAKHLVEKVSNSNSRGIEMCNRLTELHGSSSNEEISTEQNLPDAEKNKDDETSKTEETLSADKET